MIKIMVRECFNPFDIPPSYRVCEVCNSLISVDASSFFLCQKYYTPPPKFDTLSPMYAFAKYACSPSCAELYVLKNV